MATDPCRGSTPSRRGRARGCRCLETTAGRLRRGAAAVNGFVSSERAAPLTVVCGMLDHRGPPVFFAVARGWPTRSAPVSSRARSLSGRNPERSGWRAALLTFVSGGRDPARAGPEPEVFPGEGEGHARPSRPLRDRPPRARRPQLTPGAALAATPCRRRCDPPPLPKPVSGHSAVGDAMDRLGPTGRGPLSDVAGDEICRAIQKGAHHAARRSHRG